MADQSGATFLPASQSSVICILLMLILLPALATGQMVPGSVALTTAVGQGSDAGFAYALSPRTRINLGLGFSTSSPDGGNARSVFSVQPGVWFILPATESVAAFYGGSVEFRAVSGSPSQGDAGLVLSAGAEYAFSRRLSVGSLVGLAYRFGDTSADGQKGSSLTTTRVGVFLTWWII